MLGLEGSNDVVFCGQGGVEFCERELLQVGDLAKQSCELVNGRILSEVA